MTTAPDLRIACKPACAMNQTDIVHACWSLLQTSAATDCVVAEVHLLILLHVDVDNISGIHSLLQPFQQLLLNTLLQLSSHLSLGLTLPFTLLCPAQQSSLGT